MARRIERESSGFGSKLTVWVAVILITIWASRDPHQALAVVHVIVTAIGNAASHHTTSGH